MSMDQDIKLQRELFANKICAELNNFVDLKHTLATIISELKELTGFEAISIRLREDDDYPFYVYNGFAEDFIQKEKFLCPHTGGEASPECLCGNVISKRFDAKKPYYTNGGSFFTNNSNVDAEALKKNETVPLRLEYQAEGYQSIGLFPIKTREENIGLIQLNDKRPNMFNEHDIEYLEYIGSHIGIAIENSMLYEKVKSKNEELENTIKELTNAQSQLLEAKKITALADLVTGIAHEVYNPISESLHLIESAIVKTKEIVGEPSKLEQLLEAQKIVYNNLSDTKALIKSFRSIASDQFQESRHLVNIQSFLNDIIRIIKPTLDKKHIEFNIECNANTEILSYSGIISQAVVVLIRNSYEHGLKNTKSGKINLSCNIANEETLELAISDNGCGIAENIQHKIFEPFFTTEKKSHTGLGLYHAKTLVENKLKGKLLLDTNFGDGARFVIQIPV